MRFLLDESVPFRLAGLLTAQGHDVTTIGREHPHALADRDVLAIASSEQRTLITNDTDFGELIFRQHLPHAGVILLRLGDATLPAMLDRINFAVAHHASQLDHFLVVTAQKVRVRRQQP